MLNGMNLKCKILWKGAKMDIVKRFPENPLIKPEDVKPSKENLIVECVFNPGVFEYKGLVGLLCRVAERPEQEKDYLKVPVMNPFHKKIEFLKFSYKDPLLDYDDPRKFRYKNKGYLTTLSHLRLAWSQDGVNFKINEKPTIEGETIYETFGVEDARVTKIENKYYITHTAVSENGVCVALRETTDWLNFKNYGIIFPPHNKDCVLFPEKINGKYYALHRPSGILLGGNFIWISSSSDLIHWGNHSVLVKTRDDMWDSERVGACGVPIKTEKGWIVIYHAADDKSRYCVGALLLDYENPEKVISRCSEPFMEPTQEYEKKGFFGNVVFTNGHIIKGDELIIYYGAADKYVCGGKVKISDILSLL